MNFVKFCLTICFLKILSFKHVFLRVIQLNMSWINDGFSFGEVKHQWQQERSSVPMATTTTRVLRTYDKQFYVIM